MNWDHVEHASLSDIGLRRANNQDSHTQMLAGSVDIWRNRGHLFMVADGMGAHAAGELASQLATESVPHAYSKFGDKPAPFALAASIEEANRLIHSRGKANAEFEGMGTTTSVLVLLPQGAVVAQVGDSRVYRLRGQTLDQLSRDHSLVWELQARGTLPADCDYFPKNYITRSLGPLPQVQVDLEGPFPIQPGDSYLLCSDGLTGPVPDVELGAILSLLPTEEASQTLIDLANLRGGPDNITVIVARVPSNSAVATGQAGEDSWTGRAAPQNWAAWAGLAAVTAVAIGAAFYGSFPAAGTLLAVAAVGATALIRKQNRALEASGPKGPFGQGPYRTYQCPVDEAFVEKLKGLVDELREAAEAEHWVIDWPKFKELGQQATAARSKGDFPNAARAHLRAMSFMMKEAREKRQKKTVG